MSIEHGIVLHAAVAAKGDVSAIRRQNCSASEGSSFAKYHFTSCAEVEYYSTVNLAPFSELNAPWIAQDDNVICELNFRIVPTQRGHSPFAR